MESVGIRELAEAIGGQVGGRVGGQVGGRVGGQVGGRVSDTAAAAAVTGVATDSRAGEAGDCFFAIRGPSFDGHDYVCDALGAGAVCAVVTEDWSGAAGAAAAGVLIRVGDTVRALGDMARWYRRKMGFKVVGITGSAGKTTTRQIVHHVLSRHFRCHQAQRSFNNNIGLPLTLLGADKEHEIVIAELGSSAPGEIAYLTGIARPDVAVVTNIYPAHMEGFGDIDAIVREKASIAEGLGGGDGRAGGGVFLINGDSDELVEYCSSAGLEYVTFGEGAGCDIVGAEPIADVDGGQITIEGVALRVGLCGMGNLRNTLAAWAVCSQFGISVDDFAVAAGEVAAAEMRLAVERVGRAVLIDDCYNANPTSMANALEFLSVAAAGIGGRGVFVCGTMAELGEQSARLHVELGRVAARRGVEVVLAAGEFAQEVAKGVGEICGDESKGWAFESVGQLCNNLHQFVQQDDIVLVKGSRSAGLERAVDKLRSLLGGQSGQGVNISDVRSGT